MPLVLSPVRRFTSAMRRMLSGVLVSGRFMAFVLHLTNACQSHVLGGKEGVIPLCFEDMLRGIPTSAVASQRNAEGFERHLPELLPRIPRNILRLPGSLRDPSEILCATT